MKQDKENNNNLEAGEEQLHELIKQAGEEVRLRNNEALARHLKMPQAAVAEGVERRKKSTKALASQKNLWAIRNRSLR